MSRWPSATRRRSAARELAQRAEPARAGRLLLRRRSRSRLGDRGVERGRSAALVGWPARSSASWSSSAERASSSRRAPPRAATAPAAPRPSCPSRRRPARAAAALGRARVAASNARSPCARLGRAARRSARAAPDRRRPSAPARTGSSIASRCSAGRGASDGKGPCGDAAGEQGRRQQRRGSGRHHRLSLCARAAPATPARATGCTARGLRRRRPCPYVAASRAPVAQLDRAPDYESGGRRFESFRARHFPDPRRTSGSSRRAQLDRSGLRRVMRCLVAATRHRCPQRRRPCAANALLRRRTGSRRRSDETSRRSALGAGGARHCGLRAWRSPRCGHGRRVRRRARCARRGPERRPAS